MLVAWWGVDVESHYRSTNSIGALMSEWVNESDCWSFGMICPCAIATVAARTWNAE